MRHQLTHRTAVITGSNSMVGIAIARRLAKNGFSIIAHCHHHRDRIDAFALEYPGVVRMVIEAELDEDGVRKILGGLARDGTYVDVLVNNAASLVKEMPASLPEWNGFRKSYEVNAIAPAVLANSIFEKMRDRGGKIINISSIGVKYGGGETTLHYAMSKAALETLTVNLAKRGSRFRILANTVRPGVINTDFHGKYLPGKDMEKRASLIPLKRMAEPDEVAAIVAFLVSPDGDYITGETFTVAGGD